MCMFYEQQKYDHIVNKMVIHDFNQVLDLLNYSKYAFHMKIKIMRGNINISLHWSKNDAIPF